MVTPSRPGTPVALTVAATVLVGAIVVALGVGSSPLGPLDVLAGLLGDPALAPIVRGVRLPTVALGVAVGAALGAAGVVTQSVLRNPLADPYVLGLSGGASVGVGVATLLLPASIAAGAVPVAAFAGATLALGALALVATRLAAARGDATTSLLLAGVVLNALAGAFVLVLHTMLAPGRSQQLLFALVGSLQPAVLDRPVALGLAALGVAALVVIVRRVHALNLLMLGDAAAAGLGLDVRRARGSLLLAASALVAAAVAGAGVIGFVGLVVPHAVRRLVGPDARLLLPCAAIGGAAAVVAADAVARLAFVAIGGVLPVGAVTALVGAPLFVWLLVRRAPEGR